MPVEIAPLPSRDPSTPAALIMRGPGVFSGGKVCDAMVSHVDLFPTLCEYLGIEKPAWLAGKSLLPVLEGKVSEVNEEIFAEVTFHAAPEPKRAVRTKRWKYIRWFNGRRRSVLSNADDGPSKTVWMDHGWHGRAVAAEQLFDLVFDPCEMSNLAGDPGHGEILAEMRARLERHMRETGDPLAEGPIVPQKGEKLNDPDGLSPREEAREWA